MDDSFLPGRRRVYRCVDIRFFSNTPLLRRAAEAGHVTLLMKLIEMNGLD
jgi:hypothetical protein